MMKKVKVKVINLISTIITEKILEQLERFQGSFENTDKEFLKKIKVAHSSLTSDPDYP
jgi:predicted DNA-binding antitoxin AbrB/MazE fold protein